ncbi:UNVERIFIED_CONTAM: helix-turn-helix domain-containing protein, partial [Microbacterium sp. SLM126]
MDTLTPGSEAAIDFPGLLRYWRARRGYSQLALSLAAGVSQRHISFLESGRARPSREMVLALAERLGVPLRQRNRLLLARLFMDAYPVLRLDQTVLPADQQPARWTSAMTYKIVGALRSMTEDRPYQRLAVWIGVGIGLVTEVLRKALRAWPRYMRFAQAGRAGRTCDFVLDAVVLPSPYASSFGGFVNLPATVWMAAGGVAASLWDSRARRA